MRKHLSKKRVVLAAIVVVALAIASGVAYAYFTATGAGTGSATVGSSTAIAITSDAVTGLYPAGADVTVSVHVKNNGSGSQYVNVVSGTVADNGSCLGSWFVVDAKTLGATIANGATSNTTTKVRMLDSGGSQNVCVGLPMTINWASN